MKNLKIYHVNEIPELHFFFFFLSKEERRKFRSLFWNGSGFVVHFKGQKI